MNRLTFGNLLDVFLLTAFGALLLVGCGRAPSNPACSSTSDVPLGVQIIGWAFALGGTVIIVLVVLFASISFYRVVIKKQDFL